MTARDLSKDPLFQPLSAKVLPAKALFTISGKVMTDNQARMAARQTTRHGNKGPVKRQGDGK